MKRIKMWVGWRAGDSFALKLTFSRRFSGWTSKLTGSQVGTGIVLPIYTLEPLFVVPPKSKAISSKIHLQRGGWRIVTRRHWFYPLSFPMTKGALRCHYLSVDRKKGYWVRYKVKEVKDLRVDARGGCGGMKARNVWLCSLSRWHLFDFFRNCRSHVRVLYAFDTDWLCE